MRNVEPKVYLIASTVMETQGMDEWLNDIGAKDYKFKQTTDPENLVMAAAKRCYMSFEPGLNPNVKKVRDDAKVYLDNILKVGHGSVLEHAYFTFAIENVSRVFTGEMNRHRAGMAISEGSMRFIRFTDIPFWMPNSLRGDPSDSDEISEKKARSRTLFIKAFQQMEDNYTKFVEIWDFDNLPDFKSKKHLTSCARRIIGMGVASGGTWTGNIRALRHILTMRCDESAEEEICIVAVKILEIMMKECPIIFGDFHVNEKGFWGPEFKKV